MTFDFHSNLMEYKQQKDYPCFIDDGIEMKLWEVKWYIHDHMGNMQQIWDWDMGFWLQI